MGVDFVSRMAATALLLVASQPGIAASGERLLSTPHFTIRYHDIDEAQAKIFSDRAEAAFAKVTTYLRRPYAKTIHISIGDRYIFPDFNRAEGKLVIPASRIRGDAGGPSPVRGRGTAITLIITKVIAPSANKDWSRFFEVGLGVFMQEKFGAEDDRSYPNMGRDLHKATARMIAAYGRFIPLAKAEQFRIRRKRPERTRRLAYLEEGSFVRFLIETRGLEKFMEVYDGRPFEEMYGVGSAGLEKQWMSHIKHTNR